MEIVFNNYINEQVDKEDKEVVKLRRRKVPCISGDDSGNEYSQSLLVDEDLTSLRSQKRIKLTTELNRYYDAGLEFIKIRDKNGSEVNDVLPDPLNWWLITGRVLYLILAKIALDLFSIPAMSSACERAFSQTKKVVTDERNKLTADTIEAD
jgi:hAT family C-terminal dimerisation region